MTVCAPIVNGPEAITNMLTGKLTMYLEKESYERAGVVGQPHGVKGKRGLRPRWSQIPR
jgi:ribonucleases P/MRP protein subunit RPP40